MDLLEALYTTRAMRRVRPDPLPDGVVAAMIDAAVRAPSGGNTQNWRFLAITDPVVKAALGPLYRRGFQQLQDTVYKVSWTRAREQGDQATLRVIASSTWLAEHFEEVPLWLLAFSRNDPSGASIYPAVWSAMLAARGHGVGTCLTTILGLFTEAEAMAVLGVPSDKGWRLKAAVSCGYPEGRWGLAGRRPAHEVAYAQRWGDPLPFAVDRPLWEPSGG